MNCRHIIIFNKVTVIFKIIFKSRNQVLYPRVMAVCRLHFEPLHDFFLYRTTVVDFISARCFFRRRKKLQSLGARSGLYGR